MRAMKSVMSLTACLMLSFVLVACGSGDGGGQGQVITGNAQAPNGQLAQADFGFFQWFASLFSVTEGIAQQGGNTLGPVPQGTNILVFQIDDAGVPVGGTIASGTTNANGEFSVTLPAGRSFASNLIVQASASTTPQAICTGGGLWQRRTELSCGRPGPESRPGG